MKKIILILTVMLLPVFSACASSQDDTPYIFYFEGDVRIFDIDYLEKYEDTLNAMFDYEWTLLTVEEKYVSIEEVYMRYMIRSAHPSIILPEQFTVWTIEYRDGNGDVRRFVFDNRSDFSHQIERYVANSIAEFYREKFFDYDTMGVSTLEVSSVSLFGMFVRLPMFTLRMSGDPAMIELDDTTREYKRLLSTPEGTINLSSLTLANVFEMAPFYLWISINLDEYAEFDQQNVEIAMKQIEEILEDINYFTNHSLNASVSIFPRIHGVADVDIRVQRHEPLYYIQGEEVFDQIGVIFQKYLFESYRGVFW